jgi:hypothetical protein
VANVRFGSKAERSCPLSAKSGQIERNVFRSISSKSRFRLEDGPVVSSTVDAARKHSGFDGGFCRAFGEERLGPEKRVGSHG